MVNRTIFREGNSNLRESCPIAEGAPGRLVARRRETLDLRIELLDQGVEKARVSLLGAGVNRAVMTNSDGKARIRVKPKRRGTILVRMPNVAKQCVTRVIVRRR